MSKEILDKINNNLIMLVEGFDDAERDYGYDLANEKHYVSELIDLVKNLSLSGVNNRRELLSAFSLYVVNAKENECIDDLIINFDKEYCSS
jgi:hypothetical protein